VLKTNGLLYRAVQKCAPRSAKKLVKRHWKTRLQRDLEQFKEHGTRFAPPLTLFPPMVLIDTTTRCNLHCVHCPHSALAEEPGFIGDMDLDLCFKILDEIGAEASQTTVRLFDGGEPLMRQDLADLVRYAKNQGICWVSINTNGTLLSERRRKELIEAGLNHIEVSIDAATSETYEKIRCNRLFKKVVENTLHYIQESKAYNPRNQVTVSFVEQMDNRHELESFRSFWAEKADVVYVREYHRHHNMIENNGRIQAAEPEKRRWPCPYLWNRMSIHHDGRVRFCELDWRAEHMVGNVQTQSLKEIWRGEALSKLRQQHIEGTIEHSYCNDCEDWTSVRWEGL